MSNSHFSPNAMLPSLFFAALFAWVLPGCSSNKTDDGYIMGGDTGGFGAVFGGGGSGAKAGGGAATVGGGAATVGGGGTNAGGGTATAGDGGVNANAGGATRRLPDTSAGGNPVTGPTVCDVPNVCGTVLDAKDDVYECGFKNCPQEVCGLNAPNQCPAACTNKIACASDDCGRISDGCGGIIDCGYTNCPKGACGITAPSKCPPSCKAKPSCSATDCGLIPDGCGGTIDCGYTNCPKAVCGEKSPNQCPPACAARIDCKSAGNKDCGQISDGCGGLVDCGSTNCPANLCGITVPNQCPTACKAKIDCKSAGNKDCGFISDGCGGLVDCNSNKCPAELCGVVVPNQCPASCGAKMDCKSAGNKDCGQIADGCGGIIDCGTCAAPLCCGCGTTSAPGSPNKCGGGTVKQNDLTQTCLAGQKGCLCDSTGSCAPGFLCNKSKSPAICCTSSDSTDCDIPAGTTVGATCAGTGQVGCTPGITIPSASGANDNCGYPATSFKESSTICGIVASGGGATPAQVQAYFSDENDTTLGCNQNGYTITPMSSNPGYAYYPSTGDPNCVDSVGRPLRPSLYITDITSDPNCKAGDQQNGGTPYDPVAIFGSWKAATNGTPDANPDPFNYWDLSPAGDPIPASVLAQCPCQPPPAGTPIPSSANSHGSNVDGASNCPGAAHQEKGFGTEVRYEAGFLSGHSYRLQVIGHDGDQTQGGDSGEACVIFCAEGETACQPIKCVEGLCGPQSDGCGGIVDCPCTCKPQGCPVGACGKVGDGCGGTIDCPCQCVPQGCPPDACGKVGDGCGGTIDCGPCCTTRTCPDGLCGKVPDGCGGIIDCACECVPNECPAGACGKMPDGCGGELDCGPCCTPWTCDDWCPADNSGNIRACSSTMDDVNVPGATYLIDCPKPDGCYDIVHCYCPIG
jgi:hypothetical protein